MKKIILVICTFCAGLVLAAAFVLAAADLSAGELRLLLSGLARHNSFQYINYHSLPETWFTQARHSLEDPHLYIVLSNTKTAASKVIARFTGDPFNHVSLAFDPSLSTLVSYNGGNTAQKPGLNPENRAELRRNAGSTFSLYRLPASRAHKRRILERIERINAQGSSYNLLGLVSKRSAKPNIMFCSQFVYAMLDEAGLRLFAKDSGKVKPMDFVTLDGGRRLALIHETGPEKDENFFSDILDSRINLAYNLIRH